MFESTESLVLLVVAVSVSFGMVVHSLALFSVAPFEEFVDGFKRMLPSPPFFFENLDVQDLEMPGGQPNFPSLTDREYYNLSRSILACTTIGGFVDIYDSREYRTCITRISLSRGRSDRSEWAMLWANALSLGEVWAQRLDRDRRMCLDLLYRMCNCWGGPDANDPRVITQQDIVQRFGKIRIQTILLECLPMDRANAWFRKEDRSNPALRGLHWFSTYELFWFQDHNIGDRQQVPTMNRRLVWLYFIEELELLHIPYLARLRGPECTPLATATNELRAPAASAPLAPAAAAAAHALAEATAAAANISKPSDNDDDPVDQLDVAITRISCPLQDQTLPAEWNNEDPGAMIAQSKDTRAELPYDVFISHAGEDKKTFAAPLYQALKEADVRTFFDQVELPIGENSPHNMNAAMESALCGVFILSPEFVAKKWPMDELYCFLRRHKDSENSGCELCSLPLLVPVFHRLTLAECQFKSSRDLFKHPAFGTFNFEERMKNGETNHKDVKDALQKLSKFKGFESPSGANRAQMIEEIKQELCNQVEELRSRSKNKDFGQLLRNHYRRHDFKVARALFGKKTLDLEDLECTLHVIKNKRTKESTPVERETSELMAYEERKKWDKEPISIEDLYEPRIIMPGEPKRNIFKLLVVGGPGMGKTTMSKNLAYRWSMGKWGLQFKAVFLLPVRKLQPNAYDGSSYRKQATLPTAIVNNCFLPPSDEDAYKALCKKIDASLELPTTLVILDGLDERAGVNEDLITWAINGQHKLLMLSRAYGMEVERSMADMEVELTGLSKEQVKDYVLKVSNMDQEKAEMLFNLLAQNRTISEIAQVPVNLQILCYLWDDKSTAVQNALHQGSLSLLYKTVTREIWERYVGQVKEMPGREKEAKDLGLSTDTFEALFNTLSEIALKAWEKGGILIDKRLVQELTKRSVQGTLEVLQDSGFLLFQGVGENYQFAHLTFHEYFAGRWLAEQFLSDNSDSKKKANTFFSEHKYKPQYGRTFSFMSGELSSNGENKNGSKCIRQLLLVAKDDMQDMFKGIQLQMRLLHEWCLQHDDAEMAQGFDIQNNMEVLFTQGIDAGDHELIRQLTSLLKEFTAAAKHVCSNSLECLKNHCGDEKDDVRRTSVDTLHQLSPSMPAQCFGPVSFACQSDDYYVCQTALEALVEVLKADNAFAAASFEIFQKAYEKYSQNAYNMQQEPPTKLDAFLEVDGTKMKKAACFAICRAALVGLSVATKANTALASKFFTICFPALKDKSVRRAASYSLMAVIPHVYQTINDDITRHGEENGDLYFQALVLRASIKVCKVNPKIHSKYLPLKSRYDQEENDYIRWLCEQFQCFESLSNPYHNNLAPLQVGGQFGKEEWMVFFGDIGNIPPIPSNLDVILRSECPFWKGKKIFETHLLVLIPSTLDGEPYSLDLLEDMIQFPQEGERRTRIRCLYRVIKTQITGNSPEKPHWVLMTHDLIPGSVIDDYEKQKKMVKDHAERTGLHYQLPSALEAATTILMHYVRTGIRLFQAQETRTVCRDVIRISSNESTPVLVGDFFSHSLYVNFFDGPWLHGVACLCQLESP